MSKNESLILKSDHCRVFLINCEIEDVIHYGLGHFDCLLPDQLKIFSDDKSYLVELPEELINKYTSSIIVNGYLNIIMDEK